MNSIRILVILLTFLGTVMLAAPITNSDVVKMVTAGVDEGIIISAIQNSEPKFDIGTDGLISLSQAKVPQAVVAAMIQRASGAAMPSTSSNQAPAQMSPPPDVQAVIAVDNGQETRLTYARADSKVRLRALGFGGGAAYFCMDGSNAKIRLKSRTPEFVAWLPSDAVPETQVDLTLWAARNNNTREILCANSGAWGSSSTGFPKDRLIKMEFTRTPERSPDGKLVRYQFKPTGVLVPGEYALIFGENTPRCFDFGID
jgi:hypothetical protein